MKGKEKSLVAGLPVGQVVTVAPSGGWDLRRCDEHDGRRYANVRLPQLTEKDTQDNFGWMFSARFPKNENR